MQSLTPSLNEKLRLALEQRVTFANVSSGIMPPMPVFSSASRVASDNTPGTPTNVIQSPTPSGLQLMRAAAVPDDVMSRLYYDSHVTSYPRDVAPLYVMRQHDVRDSTGHKMRHTDMECVQDTEKAEIEEFLRVHCLRMAQGCRDVPVKELRHIIPILILQCFSMKGEQAQKKVKGLWERAPQGWPADVPYCDPNNAPLRSRTGEPIGTKPKKETLNHMFDFLIREYLRQNREFLPSPVESRDSMTQQYSSSRLLPPSGLWHHHHHQQQQQPAALPISSQPPHPHSYASVYNYSSAVHAAPTNTTAASGPASLLQYPAPHLSRALPHPNLVSARTRLDERSNAYEDGRHSNLPWESRVVDQAEVSSISQASTMALKRSHSYDEMSSPYSEDSISSQTSVTDHMPPLLDCRNFPLALTSTKSSVPVFHQPTSPCSIDGQGVLVTQQQQQQTATSSSSQRPMTKKARLLAAVLPPLSPIDSETSDAAASPPLPPSPSSSPITPTTPHSVNEQAMNELMGRIADKMQALQQRQVAVDRFTIILVAQELLWKMRSLLDDVWVLPYLEKLHELDCTLDAIGMLGCLPDSHATRWQDFEEKWYVRINGYKRITSASSTAFTGTAAAVSINTVHATAPSTATYC